MNVCRKCYDHRPTNGVVGRWSEKKVNKVNKEFSDPKHISDAFNNYFANVGNKLENEIPRVNKRPEEYLRLPQSNSFFISPTTTTEIENIISSLKSGKAVGPFSIPIDILKLLKSAISKPLEILFNTILNWHCPY